MFQNEKKSYGFDLCKHINLHDALFESLVSFPFIRRNAIRSKDTEIIRPSKMEFPVSEHSKFT